MSSEENEESGSEESDSDSEEVSSQEKMRGENKAKKGETQKYYSVEKILGHWRKDNKLHFFVKWEGYSEDQNSWVCEDNFTGGTLRDEYKKALAENDDASLDTPQLPNDSLIAKVIVAIEELSNERFYSRRGVSVHAVCQMISDPCISDKKIKQSIEEAKEQDLIKVSGNGRIKLTQEGKEIIVSKKINGTRKKARKNVVPKRRYTKKKKRLKKKVSKRRRGRKRKSSADAETKKWVLRPRKKKKIFNIAPPEVKKRRKTKKKGRPRKKALPSPPPKKRWTSPRKKKKRAPSPPQTRPALKKKEKKRKLKKKEPSKKKKNIQSKKKMDDPDLEFVVGFTCEYCFHTSSTVRLYKSTLPPNVLNICHACSVYEKAKGILIPRGHRHGHVGDIKPKLRQFIEIWQSKKTKIYKGLVQKNGKVEIISENKDFLTVKKKVQIFVHKIRPKHPKKENPSKKRKRRRSRSVRKQKRARKRSAPRRKSLSVERFSISDEDLSGSDSADSDHPDCDHCGKPNNQRILHRSMCQPSLEVCWECFLYETSNGNLPKRRSSRLAAIEKHSSESPQPSSNRQTLKQSPIFRVIPETASLSVNESELDLDQEYVKPAAVSYCPQTRDFLNLLNGDPTYADAIVEITDANLSFEELFDMEDEQMELIGIGHPLKIAAFRKKLKKFKVDGSF